MAKEDRRKEAIAYETYTKGSERICESGRNIIHFGTLGLRKDKLTESNE